MFGKDKNGKLLIDNISEMKVVSYMKGLRSKGWSYFRISDRLNEKGIVSKSGGKWYGMSVSNVLSYYLQYMTNQCSVYNLIFIVCWCVYEWRKEVII